MRNVPGDNSDTGVLDGVGLCPGAKKWEGEPLLEPVPAAPTEREKEKKHEN